VAGFTVLDPVPELQQLLLNELPSLQQWLDEARAEHGEDPQSEYWLFSYVVRPYLNAMLASESEAELERAWVVLERIASAGPASAQNELFVAVEELDIWRFYRFLGPVLRNHWFEAITWYPTRKTRTEAINTHVDQQRFRARWAEEIRRIGGFEALTTEQEGRIASTLWREFGIHRV
jgi:hypothetical protein